MKLYLSLLCMLLSWTIYSQEIRSYSIQNVQLSQKGNTLKLHYDLIDAAPDESFKVWVEVVQPDGEQIDIQESTGAIGDAVTAGENKTITIQLSEEAYHLTTALYVEVFARSNEAIRRPYFTKARTNYLLKSLVFPGWGQADIRQSKISLVLGGVSYLALGGSIYFNRKAQETYDNYLASETINERNSLLTQARDEEERSEILAYTAGAIWAGNLIWALLDRIPESEQKLSIRPANEGAGLALRFTF